MRDQPIFHRLTRIAPGESGTNGQLIKRLIDLDNSNYSNRSHHNIIDVFEMLGATCDYFKGHKSSISPHRGMVVRTKKCQFSALVAG
ncbi:hypothetical protein NPIL_146281 [Nephila pilipes]|uniref:Uncharacterized protein n=1 Tax=Nephila pilipes TaxID=299642 RepID=A0A8X6Q8Y6_NEPPI|nr:hypothetical protein NPIL_146281 [Nephila pilipes]